jgi:broad specificity phosphatase PhoE
MAMPNHLVLVRHGLSEGNFARDMAKEGDPSYFDEDFRERPGHEWRLMPEGVEQAQRAGLWIQENVIKPYGLPGFDRYFYSPHRRTAETAASLELPGAAWRLNRMLRERSWGEIEELSREEHQELYPRNYAWQQRDKMNWSPPGGESVVQISDGRVREFFDTLHRDHDQKAIKSAIAVTHGEWIWAARLALEYMSNEDWEVADDDPSEKIHNCQVVHYTRIDPKSGEIAPYLKWMRSVKAGEGEQGPGDWRESERAVLGNEELLIQAEQLPRLW